MRTKALSIILKVNVKTTRNQDIRHMNANPRYLLHKSLMGIATTIRSLGIEKVNVDPSPIGHLTSQVMHLDKVILMIGTTTHVIVVTTIRNMHMFLRFA